MGYGHSPSTNKWAERSRMNNYRFHMRDKSTKDVSAPDLTQAEKKISIKADGYDFVEPIAGEVLTPAGRTSEQASTANATLSKLDSEKHEQKAATPARVRKPRSDKGRPRQEEKPKRIRGGQFFVCSRVNTEACKTKDDLWKYLETVTGDVRVIQGRELQYERNVSYKLKPTK